MSSSKVLLFYARFVSFHPFDPITLFCHEHPLFTHIVLLGCLLGWLYTFIKFHLIISIVNSDVLVVLYNITYHWQNTDSIENNFTNKITDGKISSEIILSVIYILSVNLSVIHPAKKGYPFFELPSHSMSLHWERVHVPEVFGHGRHLAAHGHQKCCQKNQQCSCLNYSLMIFS